MINPFSLKSKTILITGGSSGIGKEIAILCSKMGAKVVVVGRNEIRLKETLESLEGEGHIQLLVDLTNNEEVQNIIQEIPLIDGVVFSAGINDKSLIKFISSEKIEKIFSINCFSPMLLMKSLLKKKKINKYSSVIFISSISSDYATVSNSLYSATKGAINSLLRVLALELSPKKIRVNGISPGMINTQMVNKYNLSKDEYDAMINEYPLKRVGETSDIANGAVYLLSDASSWVTGINLKIDGGCTLR
jgi:NAD(P)-dependent dehydrogenase (short-subunit alcohol dehydrogenase family)